MDAFPDETAQGVGPRPPRSADVRREARARLNEGEHRFTLILASLLALTACVGTISPVSLLRYVGSTAAGRAAWLRPACCALLGALILLVLGPLCVGVYRLAVRMSLPSAASERLSAADCLYVFSSPRAYGRALAVGAGTLLWTSLTLLLPLALFRAAEPLFASLSAPPWLSAVLRALLSAAFGFAAFLLSGRRAGFGYAVFARPDESLRSIGRDFRRLRRPLVPVLAWRMSLTGWFLLSAAGILIPLFLHALPYALCCEAAYARSLHEVGRRNSRRKKM